jgi:hypothetical protein
MMRPALGPSGVLYLWAALLALAPFPLWAQDKATRTPLDVDIDFPGGSARIEGIDQAARSVRLVPSPHADRGWVCWWYIKLKGIEPGETITLDVGEGVWATPDSATFSIDGQHWLRTPAGKRDGKRITYSVKVDAREAWLAWGPPFVPADAERLVADAAKKCPHAAAFELCRTREDRTVPALRVSQPGTPDKERFGIWIEARQHAWESGSSWVARGFTEWLVSEDPRAETLRKKSLITIVPIMDIDNVAIGAGGKDQKPQDHNRDWTDEPYHKSVAAAQREIVRWNESGNFDLFIDLHNPGPGDKLPFYFVSPREMLSDLGKDNLTSFIAANRLEMTGPLKFDEKLRESGANYDKNWQAISKNWVAKHTRDHVVSLTLETAWNTPESTTENYLRVGKEMGLAVERYLQTARRRAADAK